jgi:hypothetical protein
VFNNFIALTNTIHESINLHWITTLNIQIDHQACEFVEYHMWATSLYQIGASIFVTREIYGDVAYVKWKCHLILKLQG